MLLLLHKVRTIYDGHRVCFAFMGYEYTPMCALFYVKANKRSATIHCAYGFGGFNLGVCQCDVLCLNQVDDGGGICRVPEKLGLTDCDFDTQTSQA